MIGSLTEYALRYAKAGFRVLPLYGLRAGSCGCGSLECRTPGKHPVAILVGHGSTGASTDDGKLRRWFDGREPGEINIGIAFDAGLVAVDIDPRNGGDKTWSALIATHGAIPQTATAITGGGGTHYLFRVPPDAKVGKPGPGIDIKGKNTYIVVEPSVHISGSAYSWAPESDPTDGAEIADMPEWLLRICSTKADIIAEANASAERLEARKVAEIEDALLFIDSDARDTWLKVGMALHSTRAGDQAKGIWLRWSQGSPKFNLKEQNYVWKKFSADGGTTLSTLFALAKAGGWIESKTSATAIGGDLNRRNRIIALPAAAPPKPDLPPIPARTAHVLVESLELTGLPRAAAVATAVILMCATTARRYTEPTHLYLTLAAHKTVLHAVRRTLNNVLTDANMDAMVRDSRILTPAYLYETIWHNPARLYVAWDIADQSNTARRQPNGTLDHVFSILESLIDDRRRNLESAAEAGIKGGPSGMLTLIAPSLSMLAMVEHDKVGVLFNTRSSLPGLLAQSTYVDAGTEAPATVPATSVAPHVIEHIRRICRPAESMLAAALDGCGGVAPNLITMRAAPTSAALAHTSETERRTALRVAAAIAAWEQPEAPAVDAAVLEWAAEFARRGWQAFAKARQYEWHEDGRRDAYDDALAAIAKRETAGMPIGELPNFCRSYRRMARDKRDELVNLLIEDRQIIRVAGPRGGQVLVAAAFAPVDGLDGASSGSGTVTPLIRKEMQAIN